MVLSACLAASLLFAAALGCAGSQAPMGDVKLVVLLVADQFSADYFDRFDPLFADGLRRLRSEGAEFSSVRHDHANTSTCPGHATLVSGLHPSRSGVVGNQWIDRRSGRRVYCVGDAWHGVSPKQMLGESIGDWVRRRGGKVFAASGKDRSAVILGGKSAHAAYWYEGGGFRTSNYYKRVSRPWLEKFRSEVNLDHYFGKLWEPLPVDAEQLREAGVVELDEGEFPSRFPHAFGVRGGLSRGSDFYGRLASSPFADEYLEQFAQALIRGERLGQRGRLDFLALSFSALDFVGHAYGPNSREVLDTVLRLDRTLGELLRFLDKTIGQGRYLVVFSSDHGVQPLPEFRRKAGHGAQRFSAADIACLQKASAELDLKFNQHGLIKSDTLFDQRKLEAAGVSAHQAGAELRRLFEACGAVRRVWLRDELAGGALQDPYGRLHQHSFHAERSGDFVVQLEAFALNAPLRGTDHGSPYAYDREVPLIFYLPTRIRPEGSYGEPVATVDVAPTLAKLLGLEAPPDLDGHDRSRLLWLKQ